MINPQRQLERFVDQAVELAEHFLIFHLNTDWNAKMDSTDDGDRPNVVTLRSNSPLGGLQDSALTADGLLLLRAFNRISSPDDRRRIIALAERLAAVS